MTHADLEQRRSRDAESRRIARTVFDRPVVLEAGAGTGKTATLVARLIVWSLTHGWQHARERLGEDAGDEALAAHVLARIQAITFTERAAAEMAERVARDLGRLLEGADVPGFELEELDLAREDLERRLRALLAVQDQLAIGTIHAFCRRVLAAHALEAGLHPAFQVDADGARTRAIARAVLLESLPDLFGDRPDEDAVELAAREAGPEAIARALVELAEAGVAPADLERDPAPPERAAELRDELQEHVRAALPAVRAGFEDAPANRNHAHGLHVLAALSHLEAELPAAADVETLVAAASHADVETAARSLAKWGGADFSASDGKRLGDASADLAPRIQRIAERTHDLRRFDPELLRPATRLLGRLLREVRGRMRREGWVTFDDLLHGTRDLLAGHPPLRARLQRSIDLLLVDEFQDTDPLQYQIVAALALEGEEGERPSLFLVGDPKQSIYAWRAADLSAYADFLDRLEDLEAERRSLTVNFRSNPAILDEVERIVAPVMDFERGLQPEFEGLDPSLAMLAEPAFADGERRAVEHWVSWSLPRDAPPKKAMHGTPADTARELEARAIAHDLLELSRGEGFRWSGAAVLLRATGAQSIYLDALQRAGVPYVVERDRSYYKQRGVIDAAAALRAVIDPHDEVALVAFLRSPWVGVPDAAWIPLFAGGLPALCARITSPDDVELARAVELARGVVRRLPSDVPGLERVPGWDLSLVAALEDLAILRRSFASEPADAFVAALRARLLCEELESARFLGPHRLANLERFFGRLLDALARGEDVHGLLRDLREGTEGRLDAEVGAPGDETLDAVRVLTIHKAKGLEFDHVYLADLHHQAGRGGNRDGAPRLLRRPDGGWEMELFGARTLGLGDLERRELRVSRAEDVRTLYVAATRAAHRLVLAGCRIDPGKAPRDVTQAASHAELLARRSGGTPDLKQQATQGCASQLDADGVRWFLPAADEAGAHAVPPARPEPVDAERAGREARQLAELRESARERMERPRTTTASQRAHELVRERNAADEGPGASLPRGRALPREVPIALGILVHRALEEHDLEADAGAQIAEQVELLPVRVGELVPEELRAEALDATRALLECLGGSELLERLRALAPHVLGRELPLLSRVSDDEAPPDTLIGTIDMLYRDPETGEPVVVDFKTDRVPDGSRAAELARRYAPQGRAYVEAVADALGREHLPRFELWLLDADRVEVVETD